MGANGFAKSALKWFLGVIPKSQKQIMFESNSDFCDNTRAVYEYMIKNGYNKKYKLIWCVKEPEKFQNINEPNVYFTSFKNKRYLFDYLLKLARTKYILYTHTPPSLIPLKKQVVVNLWHGTPLKNIAEHVGDAPRFDYLISPSVFVSDILKECFVVSTSKIILTGYPRNDMMFDKTDTVKRLGIDHEGYDKIILWMPTFRQSSYANVYDCAMTATGLPLAESPTILEEINARLAYTNQYLIIKLHPAQDELEITKTNFSNIKLATNDWLDEKGVSLYNLVGEADALITDYSSIYFDYLLLNRPIAFVIDDIAQYEEKRGFVVDNPLDYMPGVHLRKPNELYDFIESVGRSEDFYKHTREQIMKLTNKYCDNKSSERLLDRVGITL